MLFECCIGEYTGRAHLDQIAAELAFQNAILVPSEIYAVAQAECVQIISASVFAIEPYAALALDAPVHLMSDQWAEILIAEGSLSKTVGAHAMAGHYCHILQVALASFVAYRAIMRMDLHESLNDCGAKSHSFGIGD